MKWIKKLMNTAAVCLCANFILIPPVMAAPNEGLDNAALERLIRERTATPAVRTGDDAGDLIMNAMGLLGVAYHFGGNSPTSGLDLCNISFAVVWVLLYRAAHVRWRR